MAPATGQGEVVFVVPKRLPAGTHDVTVKNGIGSTTMIDGFTRNE